MSITIMWQEIEHNFPKVFNKPFSDYKELPDLVFEESGIILIPLWKDILGYEGIIERDQRGFKFKSEKDRFAFILKYS